MNGDEFRTFRTVSNMPIAFNLILKNLPKKKNKKMKNIHLICKYIKFILFKSIAILRDTISTTQQISILAQLCYEGEAGWWTWHETLQCDVYVFLICGIVSSDLMFGNPASGSISTLGKKYENLPNSLGDYFCRFCNITKQMISTNYSINSERKTPEMNEKFREKAEKFLNIGKRKDFLNKKGFSEVDTPFNILNTLIIPSQVFFI